MIDAHFYFGMIFLHSTETLKKFLDKIAILSYNIIVTHIRLKIIKNPRGGNLDV